MTVLAAYRDGLKRVVVAPAVLVGAHLALFVAAVPFAAALRDGLRTHLGPSLAADAAASGVNYDWWQEVEAGASGLLATFTPSIIGFGAVLENLSALLDNRLAAQGVAGAAIVSVAVWAFLMGGILDRYARNRRTRAAGFFSACGVYFFRFMRLALFAGLGYFLLFRYVHGWLFDDLYGWATRDITVERQAFLVRVGLYVVFGAFLLGLNLLFDYAKIRAVVEDRRSMVGAMRAGARFLVRHPRAFGLYLINGVSFLALLGVYAWVAPGAGGTGMSMWLAFLIGQAYLVGRVGLKLLFWASGTAFFQAALAHAEYTAAPQPVWPDSPAVEALTGGTR